MPYGWPSYGNMDEYINKPCEIIYCHYDENPRRSYVELNPIGWKANRTFWNWHTSVIKHISKDEAMVLLL